MNQLTKENKNKVLQKDFRSSENFYESDLILLSFLNTRLRATSLAYMNDKLMRLGQQAAGKMNALSLTADKEGPRLHKRNFYGENIDEVRFHPAYEKLTEIAVESEMFRVKWEPELRQRFGGERHRLGFAAGYLYAMSESGLYCPLCMTDGVAVLIDRYCTEEDKNRLLPKIYTNAAEELYTGAMFLTEKAGGSDVGANLVTATHDKDDWWLLNGEKWFCSNASAEIIFALARTDENVKGTRGLGIFLVEPILPDGSKNSMELVRLKDKLGTRSMASGEYIFHNTRAKLIGKPNEGFKIMTDMINLSRLYNSVAALAGLRRGLIEAYQFLSYRISFGAKALDHAMIRTKLQELAALNQANFYSTWRAIEALDNAEQGNEQEAALLRLLTPMVKKATAQAAVYGVRESMELMGGMGYIEDGVIPKLMRDVMVLPIWEGAGNIMILDMLRACIKSDGLNVMLAEMHHQLKVAAEQQFASKRWPQAIQKLNGLQALLAELPRKERGLMEATAKPAFEQLTQFYQLTSMLFYRNEHNQEHINPALHYLLDQLLYSNHVEEVRVPDAAELEAMMGWKF